MTEERKDDGTRSVLEAVNLKKIYGNRTVVKDVSISVKSGEVVGLLGPNGAGKTTLFKMIMGMESIDKGSFEVGETVKVGYADQTHKDIDPKKTVYQVVFRRTGVHPRRRQGNQRPRLPLQIQFCRSRPGKTLRCALRR